MRISRLKLNPLAVIFNHSLFLVDRASADFQTINKATNEISDTSVAINGPIYVTYNSSLISAIFCQEMYVNGPVYYYMNKY